MRNKLIKAYEAKVVRWNRGKRSLGFKKEFDRSPSEEDLLGLLQKYRTLFPNEAYGITLEVKEFYLIEDVAT